MYSVSWHLLSIYSCSSFAHYLPPVGDEVHVFLSKILFSRRDFNTSDLVFAEASVSVAARRRLNLPRFSRRIFYRGQNQQTVESHYRRKQHSPSHTLTLYISFSQMLLSSRLCHCRHQQTVESEIRQKQHSPSHPCYEFTYITQVLSSSHRRHLSHQSNTTQSTLPKNPQGVQDWQQSSHSSWQEDDSWYLFQQ